MRFSPSVGPAGAGVLTIYQGATFNRPFTWVFIDPNTKERTPVNLRNASIQMQLRKSVAGEVLVDFGVEGYVKITDPEEGKFEINIPASVTQGMAFNSGVFDIEIHFDDGVVVRVLSGRMVLSREVTR